MRTVSSLRTLPNRAVDGLNKPKLGTDDQNRTVVFKSNSQQKAGSIDAYRRPPEEAEDLTNAAEIMASYIITEEFGLDGVLVEACQHSETGQDGVCSEYLEGQETLDKGLQNVEKLKNPDNAVAQVIARELIGDWDAHGGNYIVDDQGLVRSIDFGCSLNEGLSPVRAMPHFGIPQIFSAAGNRQNVTQFLDRVKSLSEEDIQGMTQRAGAQVPERKPELEATFKKVMLHNQSLMKRMNPYAQFMQGWE